MQDKVMMNDKWEFNEEVTKCFDNMLSRSIPDYDVMRSLVFSLGKHFVASKPNSKIIDIGCSNGNAIAPFVEHFGENNQYLLCDVSEPMLKECENRFIKYINSGNLKIRNYDLRDGVPDFKYSLVLSILTIQFIPIEYRHRIIQSIYDSLLPNGAFIFVEKVLGNTDDLNTLFIDEYLNIKRENQYTEEQIHNKRKSLEGVLVPITSDWNIHLLEHAGFRDVDCFWRCLNFAGFIAIK